MASTIIIYEGDGTRTDFTIPFDYLKKSFVIVRLDPNTTLTGGDYGDTGSDYYFLDKTTIRLKVAPASGESLTIRRHTSATERVVTFKDASILKATDLDTSQMQAFHIAEEGRDAINDAIIGDKEGNWDAKGHRIINVGTPIKDNDAVNLNYYKKDVGGVYQARLNAEKARDAAKVSEANAKASEIKSTQEADRAESEADRAKGYAEQAYAGQIQADWNQADSTQKDYIKNKPTIPTKVSQLNNDLGYLTKDISEVISAPGASFTGDVSATTINATSLVATGESNLSFTRIRDAGCFFIEAAPSKGLGMSADLTDGTYGAIVSVRNANDPALPGGISFSTRTPITGINTNHVMEFRNDGSLCIDGKKVVYASDTWSNDYIWYRQYSDGFIEQGGTTAYSGTGTKRVTLPVAFSSKNYSVNVSSISNLTSSGGLMSVGTGESYSGVVDANRGTTWFTVSRYKEQEPVNYMWRACGY